MVTKVIAGEEELERLYTPAQVAEYLQVERSTVWDWCRSGRIDCTRLPNRLIRIPGSAVLEFQQQGRWEKDV